MATLNREDFISRLQERIGEDNSDEAISFIEDMTDTFDDMNTRLNDSTDWKSKYEENDKAWRDRYRERFSSSGAEDDNLGGNLGGEEDEPKAPKTFEDLFEEKGAN